MSEVDFQSLTAALRSLFPQSVSVASVPISGSMAEGFPEEESCIKGANELRKREFRAGRLCARNAIEALGVTVGPIISDESRGPIWPDGVIGSISHTREHCIAAVAKTDVVGSLGLDMELHQRMKPNLWRLVLTEQELSALDALSEGDRVSRAALIFSAKEAFYKYQFPITQMWLGFQDAEVTVSPKNYTFSLKLLKNVGSSFVEDSMIQGRYAFHEDYVLSGLYSDSNKKAPKSQ